MSGGAHRGAFHQAELLDGRLRRLQRRRERQKMAVDSAFQADLLAQLQAAQPWLRKMVRAAVANDRLEGELLAAIDVAEVTLDPHERETDVPSEPFELRPHPDDHPLASETVPADGNPEWGLGPDADAAANEALRYPEPGEPALVLPSGEVVAAKGAA